MELTRYLRAKNWPVATGYLLFTGMMAVGYFYNVTFIQLGLVDLGVNGLGMARPAVSNYMALLALVTCVVALAFGYGMQRWGWGGRLLLKLQLALAVVLVQTGLTAAVLLVTSSDALLVWLICCAVALGVGVPVTFSLTTDLIPVRDRGYVAAAITAVAYFMAAVFSGDWQIEPLRERMLLVMLPGVIGLGVVVLPATLGRTFIARWVWELGRNHHHDRFANGRFLRPDQRNQTLPNRRFWQFVAFMFGIFFIDSLGFLRIIDTPILVEGAWRAAEETPRLIIGGIHVITAFIAGVLYTHLSGRHLLFWIFGLFTLTHFIYAMSVWLLPETTIHGLATPIMYATAVSLYTVVNFALWADFSTPETISWKTAVGVALSGWAATFLSTSLAIRWQTNGMPPAEHLRLVESLALLFFLTILAFSFWPGKGKRVLERTG